MTISYEGVRIDNGAIVGDLVSMPHTTIYKNEYLDSDSAWVNYNYFNNKFAEYTYNAYISDYSIDSTKIIP